jgi:hypothetical protein
MTANGRHSSPSVGIVVPYAQVDKKCEIMISISRN